MNKKNLLKLVLVFSVLTTIISCKKETEEPVNATINIMEPGGSDTVKFNEELHVEGSITGSAEMHGYSVCLINAKNSSILYSKEYHIHANSYNFHEHWVNNVTDTTTVKLKIDVTKDHDGNHEIKEMNVLCLPE